jgi:hypothetical protein
VPNLKEIKNAMKYKEKKENVVYRIVLGVMGAYLKEYDKPFFDVMMMY